MIKGYSVQVFRGLCLVLLLVVLLSVNVLGVELDTSMGEVLNQTVDVITAPTPPDLTTAAELTESAGVSDLAGSPAEQPTEDVTGTVSLPAQEGQAPVGKEDAKPEVIPEVKPDIPPEVPPEVKPDVPPEVKPEVKPVEARLFSCDLATVASIPFDGSTSMYMFVNDIGCTVRLKGVVMQMVNNWVLVDDTVDFLNLPADSKQVRFKINSETITLTGSEIIEFAPDNQEVVSMGASYAIPISAEIGARKTNLHEGIFSVLLIFEEVLVPPVEVVPPAVVIPPNGEIVPPTEVTPPKGDVVPPAEVAPPESEIVPPTEVTPPNGEIVPPAEVTPPVEVTPPAEVTPPKDETIPPAEVLPPTISTPPIEVMPPI